MKVSRFLRTISLVLLASVTCSEVVLAADARDAGPLTLVITYQTTAANRVPLRQQMRDTELSQFDK